MARLADLPIKYRVFLGAYPFRRAPPDVWSPLGKKLRQCRVALLTSAAFYLPAQEPFDERIRGGDPSFRRIPTRGNTSQLSRLVIGHRSAAFDPHGIEVDHNVALPVERFLELEADGVIGSLHDVALSFMGSITAPGRLVKKTAPEAARELQEAGVDAAFLTPV